MLHPFIAAIIGVGEPGNKICWQHTNGKAMILRGNIATLCIVQETGLVLAPMPELQLIGIAACCQCQQLMAQANAQGGNLASKSSTNGLDSLSSHFWVARTTGDNHAVKMKVNWLCKEIIIPGYSDDTCVSRKETAHNIVLCAAVNQRNSSVAAASLQHLRGGDLCNQVIGIGVIERKFCVKNN